MAKIIKSGMSKDMLDNIKNYGNEIRTLKDFVTAVRQNIGMYIGSKGNKGLINMWREILQNSFDEMNKDSSPCDMIWVHYDESTFTLTVEDNGRGIPFNNIIRIFEDQHTSSNYDKKLGEYSSGLHGVGAKVTNALSSKFIVESYVLGEARRVEFTDGYPWDKGEKKIPNKENKQGTMITFTPSFEALGELSVTWRDLYALIKLILPLSKLGSKVAFSTTDSTGKKYEELLVNEDGILTYLIQNTTAPIIKPIILSRDTGEMKMDIAFTWDSSDPEGDSLINGIVAFSNCCPTQSGYHIDGFVNGVSNYFINYMNKIYLASNDSKRKTKVSITKADIKTGLKAAISVAHLHPIFNGQAKEILANEDMEPFVKNTCIELLEEWAKSNPNDLQKLCKYLKDIAELRMKQDKEKIKLNTKYASSVLTGLPSKFVAPVGHEDLELWICEGDSAGNTMRNHRINEKQGYFPIRGKLPNAFRTAKDKFLSNEEVAGIINIIGGGYGKNFDIEKVKWKYIIIGSDADSDGEHIAILILRFFLLYMPGLIESGRVYKSNPPLYGNKIKNKMRYFITKLDYVKYIQKIFSEVNTITDIKTKQPIPSKELSKILYNNIDYTYELEKIANRYAINPLLLETILIMHINKVTDKRKFDKTIKGKFRFVDIKRQPGITILEGVIDGKYNTLFINDKLLGDCDNIINILLNNLTYHYNINGVNMSLYEMMHLFDKTIPNSIQRYKGLGEMDGQKLFESTLDPNNRTLIRYTIEDIKKEIEEIRYYESNLNVLLNDIKITRSEVLG